MKIVSFIVLSFWVWPSIASTLIPQDSSRVNVKIPYSLGTHEVVAQEFIGSVEFSEDDLVISSGSIGLEVMKLKGKDETLTCHMYESLTLDYEKSDFPAEHVCEDEKLPQSGKNAPVHTTIKVQLSRPSSIKTKSLMLQWTIHGVTRELEVPADFLWNKEAGTLRIHSVFTIDLKDFNIIVKKFLFIGVKDKVTLELELILGNK